NANPNLTEAIAALASDVREEPGGLQGVGGHEAGGVAGERAPVRGTSTHLFEEIRVGRQLAEGQGVLGRRPVAPAQEVLAVEAHSEAALVGPAQQLVQLARRPLLHQRERLVQALDERLRHVNALGVQLVGQRGVLGGPVAPGVLLAADERVRIFVQHLALVAALGHGDDGGALEPVDGEHPGRRPAAGQRVEAEVAGARHVLAAGRLAQAHTRGGRAVGEAHNPRALGREYEPRVPLAPVDAVAHGQRPVPGGQRRGQPVGRRVAGRQLLSEPRVRLHARARNALHLARAQLLAARAALAHERHPRQQHARRQPRARLVK
ncbi:Protein of unknown function, partial [Gryllus bimaculatus]